MVMCKEFASLFKKVEFWAPRLKESDRVKNINAFNFYSLPEEFLISRLFNLNISILSKFNEKLWSITKGVSFSAAVLFRLIFIIRNNEVVIYSRDWISIVVLTFAKKINLIRCALFYEAHSHKKNIDKFLRQINGVIVLNNYIASKINQKNSINTLIAHDAVSIGDFSEIKKYSFNPNKKEFQILYTGSLFESKGVYCLIDSVKFLDDRFKLHIFGGDTRYVDQVKNYIDNQKLNNQIKIYSRVKKSSLIEYQNKADILVLPNSGKHEVNLFTSPLKLFEYLAIGRPIVASKIDSIEEIVTEREVIFFEPDNSHDLARKIKKTALSDQSTRVSNSLNSAKQNTWFLRAKKIERFIQENI